MARIDNGANGARPSVGSEFSIRGQSSEVDLHEILRALWRRKYLIIGTFVLLMFLAQLAIMQLSPRYTATTRVMLNPPQTRIVDLGAVVSGLNADVGTIETEIELLRSRGLAFKTINQLKLDQVPEFNPTLRTSRGLGQYLGLSGMLPDGWLAALNGGTDDVVLVAGEDREKLIPAVINNFLKRLEVRNIGRSRVIQIGFESANPRTAALVANTLADFYIVAQLEAKFEATQRANNWLNDRLSELREQLEVSEHAVETFRTELGLLEGKDISLASQQVAELSTQLVLARAKRAEAESRSRQIEDAIASGVGIESVNEVMQSSLIGRLREQEARVVQEAAGLAEQFGERHPRMITIRAQVFDLRESIDREVDKVVQGLRNEAAVARARESSLNGSLSKLVSEVAKLNKASVKLRALDREADANRALFNMFLSRSKETNAQSNFQQADATVISIADSPNRPSYPNKLLLLSVSAIVALGTGLLVAFVVESMDEGFRSADQIENMFGVACLGLVPALKGLSKLGKTPQQYLVEKPDSAYGEAIRSVYTSLRLSDVNNPPKVVMISSSLPKEGKSSLAISMARLVASTGRNAIVIDCDLRRPAVHKMVDVASTPGIAEYLAEKASLDEVVRQDRHSPAHVIPAGERILSPTALLASDRMKELLQELKRSYDLVVVDTPPVLAVSDARVLTRYVDTTVFVVRWVETPRKLAMAALRQFNNAGAEVAGILLSMVDAKKHAQYSYSDSGYFHGRVTKYYVE